MGSVLLAHRPRDQLQCQRSLDCSGLSAAEVAEEERRQELHNNGVDPDDRLEVMRFERLEAMSPLELDAEIARLEEQLAQSEQPTP